jgi:hypothetical protein
LAFEQLNPVRLSAQKRAILQTVRAANIKTAAWPDGRPICRKQVADQLRVPFHSLSGRFTELIRFGLLEELPEPHMTYDGRRHVRLWVTPAGLQAAQEGNC